MQSTSYSYVQVKHCSHTYINLAELGVRGVLEHFGLHAGYATVSVIVSVSGCTCAIPKNCTYLPAGILQSSATLIDHHLFVAGSQQNDDTIGAMLIKWAISQFHTVRFDGHGMTVLWICRFFLRRQPPLLLSMTPTVCYS